MQLIAIKTHGMSNFHATTAIRLEDLSAFLMEEVAASKTMRFRKILHHHRHSESKAEGDHGSAIADVDIGAGGGLARREERSHPGGVAKDISHPGGVVGGSDYPPSRAGFVSGRHMNPAVMRSAMAIVARNTNDQSAKPPDNEFRGDHTTFGGAGIYCIYIYTCARYIYIHAYIHTYTHTCTRMSSYWYIYARIYLHIESVYRPLASDVVASACNAVLLS